MGRAPFNERQARGGIMGAIGSGSRASDRSGKEIWDGSGALFTGPQTRTRVETTPVNWVLINNN